MELKHRRVRFRIADVYYPRPGQLVSRLEHLFGQYELNGRVVSATNSNTPDGVYVEVELDEGHQVVIVPVSRVTLES
jgi:hypothetical protein